MTQAQQKKSEPKLDKEVEATFPASDPPSTMGSTAVAGAPEDRPQAEPNGARPVTQEHVSIDINSASKDDLGRLTAIGPKQVETLMSRRPFASWEDLKGLPGFDGEMIAALRKGGAHING